MINLKRSDIISAMPAGAAEAEKRKIFLAALDRLLPAKAAPSPVEEEDFTREDLDHAIEQALACSYEIEPMLIPEEERLSAEDLNNDKALSMIINEEVLEDTAYAGEVLGRYNEESGCYHVLFRNPGFEGEHPSLGRNSVGMIVPADIYWRMMENEVVFEGYDWFGAYVEGNWYFHKTDEKYSTIIVTEQFSFVAKAFSRNAGLLETDILQGKTAILAGVGSVGSFVAMMLAKAGVDRFILCDGDTLEIHNVSRHWLGLRHLGEYKVNAMAQEIKEVNPFARVKTFRGLIQELPEELLCNLQPEKGIVIASGDNRKCAAEANKLAERLALPFVAIGCWERAATGENFYWHKDLSLPTYEEAFEGLISDDRDQAHRAYFGTMEDAGKIRFEPGIYSDILTVTLVGIKLAQDLMNLKEERYTTRVFDHLTNYTLVANTNKPELGGERAALFPSPLFITDNRHGICLKEKGDAACLTISLRSEQP